MSAETGRDKSKDVEEAVEHYTATTIPVHIDITSQQVVLNLAEATKVLNEATLIALGPCECRQGKHKGPVPFNTCLALDENASNAVETKAGFRWATVAGALEALEATHKAGFVHLAYRKSGQSTTVFCSCCTCCCWFLNALKRFSYRDAVVESSHVAGHNEGLCVGCGQCAERCPFEAWSLRKDGGKPFLNQGNCFGCGLCVTTCPASAISFLPRT